MVESKKNEEKHIERETARQRRIERARKLHKEVTTRMITVITTALAIVAALFWQTAITDTIKTFIPVGGAWQYELIVAFFVTIIAAIAIYFLSNALEAKS